jgi:hypothetical protein
MQASRIVDTPYGGDEKIVIGIDIGTTFSMPFVGLTPARKGMMPSRLAAVAFAYLYPGRSQTVKRVASWPGQTAHRHESKIPSIVWYDQRSIARAFCAEARSSTIIARAEQEAWFLVEHFKLHVHPPSMASTHVSNLIPLPHGLSVEQVYADLLGYLFRHTRTFFKETVFDVSGGGQIWSKLAAENRIHFVITHPGGWGLLEQTMLRRATIKAGLVQCSQMAADRVQFVTEAEASVHFVMLHAELESQLKARINALSLHL